MKALWNRLAVRIDAMSLRERAFLFVSLIVSTLALADVLWVTPAQQAYRRTTQRFAAQGEELVRLRTELAVTGQLVDSGKTVRDDLAAADQSLAQTNAKIAAVAPMADKGPQLEQVLVQFLRRQEGLTLLFTGTVSDGASPAGALVDMPPGLTRRGMELRVSGPYPELVRYVRGLETAMPTLRWGQLQLQSEKQPPELGLKVFVVGVAP